jgi:hypothetical protein
VPAITSIIAGIGLAAGAIGSGVQAYGAIQQGEAQRKASRLSQMAEAQRQRGMELDSERKQYSIIREQQMQRANAIAAATSQGAQFGSGLSGGEAQIAGASNSNLLGVNQNTELGQNMFSINQRKGAADRDASAAGTMGSIGSGLSTLGRAVVNDSGTIARIGGWN